MSIHDSDFKLFQAYREKFPEGNSVAILGDCSFHMSGGVQQFKKKLDFDVVHTFDINGSPTYRENLNEPM